MKIQTQNVTYLLEKALDNTADSQKVIGQNIANVDTPNYKARHVNFQNELKSALQAYKTDPKHMSFKNNGEEPKVTVDASTSIQNNGNNVDVDKEMSLLARDQINYQALVAAINQKFQQYKIVLGGGR
ncbi:flagellar basal-body rod protein FlgB [Scopulibacillus daqui]|uniref:Flagellar basal body rod protein FlgB n=1 Tax=Scopulibacillus daqui TaxID=1469162 RepID=A0ABS2PWP2_9BACL|nr:flagellar basal body rod protein FlgB [Scopulibacillus daqui]MBM7644351.1 flagellar basal-body rod protein FlgB [Scopulibacillus daqui]